MIFILTCEQRLHTSNKKVGTRPINPRKNTNSGRNQIITNTKLHVWDTAQLSRVNLQSLNIARTEWKCNRIACKHMKTRKCCHALWEWVSFYPVVFNIQSMIYRNILWFKSGPFKTLFNERLVKKLILIFFPLTKKEMLEKE